MNLPTGRKWLTSPPLARKFSCDEPAENNSIHCTTQINAKRIVQTLTARVSALCITKSVLLDGNFGSVPSLIPIVSAMHSYRSRDAPTKTLVYVDPSITYEIPVGPGIVHADQIRQGDLTPQVVYMGETTANEAALFGIGIMFVIVKKGSCVSGIGTDQILKKLARGLKAPRFETVLIISDCKSSAEDVQHAKEIFNGFDFTYDEIDY